MKRRDLLRVAPGLPLLPLAFAGDGLAASWAGTMPEATFRLRVHPGTTGWPSLAQWDRLKQQVGDRLLKLESPFAGCMASPRDAVCSEALAQLKNAFYLGEPLALTRTSGCADAWTSLPSAYAVAAEHAADVVAAVDFARQHHLRLVVNGGGRSCQSTSDAPVSLLPWTRHMKTVTSHVAFVGPGCSGGQAPPPAVSFGAGAMWIGAHGAVTTHAGRCVQGGGWPGAERRRWQFLQELRHGRRT